MNIETQLDYYINDYYKQKFHHSAQLLKTLFYLHTTYIYYVSWKKKNYRIVLTTDNVINNFF